VFGHNGFQGEERRGGVQISDVHQKVVVSAELLTSYNVKGEGPGSQAISFPTTEKAGKEKRGGKGKKFCQSLEVAPSPLEENLDKEAEELFVGGPW